MNLTIYNRRSKNAHYLDLTRMGAPQATSGAWFVYPESSGKKTLGFVLQLQFSDGTRRAACWKVGDDSVPVLLEVEEPNTFTDFINNPGGDLCAMNVRRGTPVVTPLSYQPKRQSWWWS